MARSTVLIPRSGWRAVATRAYKVVFVRHSSLVVVKAHCFAIQQHLTSRNDDIFAGSVKSCCRDIVLTKMYESKKDRGAVCLYRLECAATGLARQARTT